MIPMIVGQAKRMVNDLVKSCQWSGGNITTDQYFTSKLLSISLGEKNLTVETMDEGRREVPFELRPLRYREVGSTIARKDRSIVLLSTTH